MRPWFGMRGRSTRRRSFAGRGGLVRLGEGETKSGGWKS